MTPKVRQEIDAHFLHMACIAAASTLYCPFLACCDCARAIKLLGVKEVVRMPREKFGGWPESWRAKIIRADEIMVTGDVTIREYDGPDLGVDYLANKTLWRI